ncbi:MAG: nucleotidyltransferase domain-containing protein [Arcicella sp.]|nr:nucleotidyltransferase domain-containing protein [Arcicella sp.]
MKDIQPIIQEFTEQAKAHYGDRLAKIILFGSYARGEAHEDSDVDLLVVLNDEEVQTRQERKSISDWVWQLFLKYLIDVSVIPTSMNKYLNSDDYLFRFIRKDGKLIYG